jgi:hypothetical protein
MNYCIQIKPLSLGINPPLAEPSVSAGNSPWHAERAGEPSTQCHLIDLSNEQYITIDDEEDTICLNSLIAQLPTSLH